MTGPFIVSPALILDGHGAYAVCGDVSVLVLNIPKWDLAKVERLYEETTGVAGITPHSLVLSETLPEAAERQHMARLQEDMYTRSGDLGERRIALITNMAAMRGAVTAWRWLSGNQIRGFSEHNIEAAASWLQPEQAGPIPALFRHCRTLMNRTEVASKT